MTSNRASAMSITAVAAVDRWRDRRSESTRRRQRGQHLRHAVCRMPYARNLTASCICVLGPLAPIARRERSGSGRHKQGRRPVAYGLDVEVGGGRQGCGWVHD